MIVYKSYWGWVLLKQYYKSQNKSNLHAIDDNEKMFCIGCTCMYSVLFSCRVIECDLDLWAGKGISLWIDKFDRGAMQISTLEGNGSCEGSRVSALLRSKPATTLVAITWGSASANTEHMGQGWCDQGEWCGTGIPHRKWQDWWWICSLTVAP